MSALTALQAVESVPSMSAVQRFGPLSIERRIHADWQLAVAVVLGSTCFVDPYRIVKQSDVDLRGKIVWRMLWRH
jgi:hypothetical protein